MEKGGYQYSQFSSIKMSSGGSSLWVCLDRIASSLESSSSPPHALDYPGLLQHLRQQLFTAPDHYYGDLQRKLHQAKIKIIEVLARIRLTAPDAPLPPTLRTAFWQLAGRLKGLNGQIGHLLKEGILALYVDLCELKERSELGGSEWGAVVEESVGAVGGLLRSYFAFQEYQARGRQRRRDIFSLRNLAKRQLEEQLDDRLLREIEEGMADRPIHALLAEYTRKEELALHSALQICRICSSHIRLDSLGRHVKNCQRKCSLEQELRVKSAQLSALLHSLREELNGQPQRVSHSLREEELRRVGKLVLTCGQRRERGGLRRSSLMGVRSEKSLSDRMEEIIEQWLSDWGEHVLLDQILGVCRERSYIEKRITALEVSNLHSENSQTDSLQATLLPSVKLIEPDSTRSRNVSLPARPPEQPQKQQGSHSSLSASSDSSLQEEQTDTSSKLRMFRTKNSLSRKVVHFQDDALSDARRCVSLQELPPQNESQTVTLSSFSVLRFLGAGAFGKVYLVRRRETGDLYALKVVGMAEEERQLQTVRKEHEIFRKIAGEHLVTAPFSFNERDSHIFVLEYLPGGDLRKQLDDEVYFEQDRAQFYLAEIVLAIEHLHNFGIIHRDLKPENLVIDRHGHLKLTDFGLSEFQIERKLAKSRLQQEEKDIQRSRRRRTAVLGRQKVRLIGTPDYIAPEIINRTSISNFTIDWWSLGVMAYELLIGVRPFTADTIEEVLDNITDFRIEWPEIGDGQGMVSAEAQDLILQLLNKDFTGRLGAGGAREIKEHPFFKGVEWERVKSVRPAWVPQVAGREGELEEDAELEKELRGLMGRERQGGRKLRLERFVRFDLLGEETLENVEKVYGEQSDRLQRLRTLQKWEEGREEAVRP